MTGHCLHCGAPNDDPPALAHPEHCGQCPPWLCSDCGEMDAPPPNSCSCWTVLEDLTLADIKAKFAADGLSVEVRK